LGAGEVVAVTQPVYEVQEAVEGALGGGRGWVPGAIASTPVRAAEVAPSPAVVEALSTGAEDAPGPSLAIQDEVLTVAPIPEPAVVEGLALAIVDEGTVPPPAPAADGSELDGTEPPE